MQKSYQLTLIGAGEMLFKYLLPALTAKPKLPLKIKGIIARSSKNELFKKISQWEIQHQKKTPHSFQYYRTSGAITEIIDFVKKNCRSEEIIVILTPPTTSFPLIEILLKQSKNLIYAEKPALVNKKELKNLKEVLKKYPRRVFFAGKYAQARAQNFYSLFHKYQKKLGKIKDIELRLEEGSSYFSKAKIWFPIIGPELDLGYHLIDILFHLFPNCKLKTNHVYLPATYLPGYGVAADFTMYASGKRTPVFLQAGKRLGPNNRYVQINFENGSLSQTFPSETSIDPISLSENGATKIIDKRPQIYHHYHRQLQYFLDWAAQPFEQKPPSKVLQSCLALRDYRFQQEIKPMARPKKNPRLVAMIPARLGSKRVPKKNLRDLAGNPLIYYIIRAAKYANVFDEIYVNSESQEIGDIGLRMGVKFYKRKKRLAQDHIKNEEFIYDFLTKIPCDYIFMLHTAPLITPKEIKAFVKKMLAENYDTMFSVEKHKAQTIFTDKAVNFSFNKPHISSQDIEPTYTIQWAVTGWKTKPFIKKYQKNKYATYAGKVGLFPLQKTSAIDVDYEEDFLLAEAVINSVKKTYYNYISQLDNALYNINEKVLESIIETLLEAYQNKRQVFFIGNGGSAVTASHFALQMAREVGKKGGSKFRSISLVDNTPLLTHLANDNGYDNIFVEQLKNLLQPKDILMTISASGNSNNLVPAIKFAKSVGATTIGLIGPNGEEIKKLTDIALITPSSDHATVEDSHIIISHIITKFFQSELPKYLLEA